MAAHHSINFNQFQGHTYEEDIDWVPTSEVARYRDPGAFGPNAKKQWPQQYEAEMPYQRNLTEKIRSEGIQNPLILSYYHHNRQAMLSEGHHRLMAAEELGHSHVPVRGLRYNMRGGVAPVAGFPGQGHVPGELRPSQFGVRGAVHSPADVERGEKIDQTVQRWASRREA